MKCVRMEETEVVSGREVSVNCKYCISPHPSVYVPATCLHLHNFHKLDFELVVLKPVQLKHKRWCEIEWTKVNLLKH
jgi:hypothetical protein